jgi:hypothetical protein
LVLTPTFISTNLDSDFREELIKLLKEYKDCFAWDYSEMPGFGSFHCWASVANQACFWTLQATSLKNLQGWSIGRREKSGWEIDRSEFHSAMQICRMDL